MDFFEYPEDAGSKHIHNVINLLPVNVVSYLRKPKCLSECCDNLELCSVDSCVLCL